MKPSEFEAMLKKIVLDVVAEQRNQTPEQVQKDENEKAVEDWKRKHAAADMIHMGQRTMDTIPKAYQEKAYHVIKEDKHQGQGLVAARYYRAMAAADLFKCSPQQVARSWGDPWLEEMIEEGLAKALTAGSGTGGGALIPEELSSEMIALLVNTTMVRKMGAELVSMPLGHHSEPRETSGPTASYVGESSNASSSAPTFDQINLQAHILRTLVAISNSLLKVKDARADMRVRDSAVTQQGLREDLAFLRGDGAANTPKGIRNLIQAANVFASTGTTVSTINTDLHKMVRLVATSNVPIVRPAWFIDSRSLSHLDSQRDSGEWVWKPELDTGKLLRKPYAETNQSPTNLGAGGNEANITFAEMSMCLIGDQTQMEVSVHPNAAYYDGTAVRSGLSRDETVIAVTSMHDFDMRHREGGSILTGVTWGA